jgi:Ca2+/Na+ antiporter
MSCGGDRRPTPPGRVALGTVIGSAIFLLTGALGLTLVLDTETVHALADDPGNLTSGR